MNNSDDLLNQPYSLQSLPSPEASTLGTSNLHPLQPLLNISPRINFYQWLHLLSAGMSAFLLLILWSILLISAVYGRYIIGRYIIVLTVCTIVDILYCVHILSVLLRRITVTPVEIIDKQGFLDTTRIMRHTIADCRAVVNDVFDETTKFRKSPIQEEVLILVDQQGETVGKIDVSAFASSDIEQLVSVLRRNPPIN